MGKPRPLLAFLDSLLRDPVPEVGRPVWFLCYALSDLVGSHSRHNAPWIRHSNESEFISTHWNSVFIDDFAQPGSAGFTSLFPAVRPKKKDRSPKGPACANSKCRHLPLLHVVGRGACASHTVQRDAVGE